MPPFLNRFELTIPFPIVLWMMIGRYILAPSRSWGKSALLATFVAPLAKSGRRISKSLARFTQPRGVDLHMIPQLQLIGVGVPIHFPVLPSGIG